MLLKVEKIRNAILVRPQTNRLDDMKILGEIRGLPDKYDLKKMNGIALDLSGVNFIGSTGISALIGCCKHLNEEKKGLVIFGVQPQVYNVFEVARLPRMIVIRDTRQDALNALDKWKTRSRDQLIRENMRAAVDEKIPARKRFRQDTPPERKIAYKAPPIEETPTYRESADPFVLPTSDETMKRRLDPLFDVIRRLRKVARKEGLDVDLNTNVGQLIAQFVQAVEKSGKKDSPSRED